MRETIIRPARPEDAEQLTMIAHAAKRHWGYAEDWMEKWGPALTVDEDYVSCNQVFVAVREGTTVGFYALKRSRHFCELDHFWVAPDSMRSGVGHALFRHALDRRNDLCPGIPLEIESDPNAEAFYLKMGATRQGEITRNWDGVIRTLPRLRVPSFTPFTKPRNAS